MPKPDYYRIRRYEQDIYGYVWHDVLGNCSPVPYENVDFSQELIRPEPQIELK